MQYLKHLIAHLICFSGLLFSTVTAQNTSTQPLQIASSATYGIKEGLATACLDKTFIDKKGRLWINPCFYEAEDFNLSFFLFDGSKSFFYNLIPSWVKKTDPKPAWLLYGITTDGFLYGTNLSGSIFFSWNPDTDERHFYRLEKGVELLNIVSNKNGDILMLIAKNNSYILINPLDPDLKRLASIKFENIASRKFWPLEVKDNKAWFLHNINGLVSVDLLNNTMTYKAWSDFKNPPNLKKHKFDFFTSTFEWKIVAFQDDTLLLYLGQDNGFYTLDLKSETLAEHQKLNKIILKNDTEALKLKLFFTKDLKGQLLLVSGYLRPFNRAVKPTNFKATLLGNSLQLRDYTNIVAPNGILPEYEPYAPPGKFFSNNFLNEFGYTTSTGFTINRLQNNLTIKSFNSLVGLRAMQYVNDSTLLVNTDIYISKFNLTPGKFSSLPNYDIHDSGLSPIIKNDNKTIWMSLETGGFLIYNSFNDSTRTIPTDVLFDKFSFISEKSILLFSNSGELFIHNLDTDEMRPYLHNGVPFTINGQVNQLLKSDNELWIGSQTGLWKIDIRNQNISNIHQFKDLSNKNILSIHKGLNKDIWLGTSSEGLLILDHKTYSLKAVSEAKGLTNNIVVGILEDDEGNRWVSTYNGISVLNTQGQVLFNLNRPQGLLNQEFNRTSFFKLRDGQLAFGGTKGLDILNPKEILESYSNDQQSEIFLTEYQYYEKENLKKIVRRGFSKNTNPIKVSAINRFIKLDFAISEYFETKEQSFAYRVKPINTFNDDEISIPWINLDATSQVTITNLPVGKHTVQVRGANSSGTQVSNILEIPIQVNDLFYRTWWFYLLCLLVVTIGFGFWVQLLRTQKKQLRIEVKKRTAKIKSDNAIIIRQTEELMKLDEAKSSFFTNISHEFRTPLTVILGMSDQLKDNLRPKQLIQRNANQLLGLVNQILDLKKLESNSMPLNMIQNDVVAYIDYIIESFHSLANKRAISLKYEANIGTLMADFDPGKLVFIMSNLLTNALKFTPAGGDVMVSLSIKKQENISYYVIRVSDTGPGISKENLPHIFDRFFQTEDSFTANASGTGVGLSLTKELVNLLKGRIIVDSKLNIGTVFIVELPLTNLANIQNNWPLDSKATIGLKASLEEQNLPAFEKSNRELPTLLVVEDNKSVIEYILSCLKNDYKLITAVDGKEGIEKAIAKVPDIIISDVMMPKVNGFDLCHTLKTDIRTSHIPIVLLTAMADLDSRIEGLKRGADAYLNKPFNRQELLVQIKNLLQQRVLMRARYENLEELKSTDDATLVFEDKFVLNLKNLIIDNMSEDGFGVPKLGELAFMSRTQLHNKIKALTNKSTSGLIRFVRIEKACELMETTNLNISEIGFELGIHSSSYFSKIFAKEKGVSPAKYKKAYQKQQ